MLCAHSSAVEMAFAANILIVGWVSIYRLQKDKEKELSELLTQVAANEYINEKLFIELAKFAIKWGGKFTSWTWRIGVLTGLVSLAFLYALMLHAPPNLELVGPPHWGRYVVAAAYICPGLMILMFLAGLLSDWLGAMVTSKLEGLLTQANKKLEEDLNRMEGKYSFRHSRHSQYLGAHGTRPSGRNQ